MAEPGGNYDANGQQGGCGGSGGEGAPSAALSESLKLMRRFVALSGVCEEEETAKGVLQVRWLLGFSGKENFLANVGVGRA